MTGEKLTHNLQEDSIFVNGDLVVVDDLAAGRKDLKASDDLALSVVEFDRFEIPLLNSPISHQL